MKTWNGSWGDVLAKLSIFGVALYWSSRIVPRGPLDAPPWIFLDAVTLVFHEAGHVIFMLFGTFLQVIGGSVMQLLVPLIACITFARQREQCGAGFSLFWLGSSAMNLSYYITDAGTRQLELLGDDPEGHDWHYILDTMNQLPYDHIYGGLMYALGAIMVLAALFWMAWAIYAECTSLRRLNS